MDEMLALLKGTAPITTEHLAQYFPEDYVRLGSPYSTLLEVTTALTKGFDPKKAFVFGSSTLPLIATLLTVEAPVRIFSADGAPAIVTPDQEMILKSSYGCDFTRCAGAPSRDGSGAIVVLISDEAASSIDASVVDAVVATGGFLHIIDTAKIPPADVARPGGAPKREGIHTIRKRLGAPPPTPDAIARLRGEALATTPDVTALKAHLQKLGGCEGAAGDVLLSTVGLSALGACVMAALEMGGSDIDTVMCSTAYGGSSQQTDILCARSGKATIVNMQKHTYDIQGERGDVLAGITLKLDAMKSGPRKALTLVQIEYPTNPDMKDVDLAKLKVVLESYRDVTGSKVILMLDTTFSPPSRAAAPYGDFPCIVFTSLSKSVTGGRTTGGSIVANDTPLAQNILERAHHHLALLDTGSKACQLVILNEMNAECPARVKAAHENCIAAAAYFEEAVAKASGTAMKTNFVTTSQMAKGVTPATFSFNLPPPASGDPAAFAQNFVDALYAAHPSGVKPCVSFGQHNSTVYVTVPATSTQGVISKEITAKQALGGVQLVRFSFPTSMDIDAWNAAVDATLDAAYNGPAVEEVRPAPLFVAAAVAAALITVAASRRSC